ncbi:MAG: hypothetical protein O2894_12640 [Planctomycetota bacterium]|nr:hypothetical protein [Planctomycetota bacterium]
MRVVRSLGLLLLAGLLLAPAPAQAEESALARASKELDAKAAESLEALAQWCQDKKLYGKRDEVYERLLDFDPQNARARDKLGYKQAEDGRWEPPARYRRPRNHAKSGQEEADAQLAEILETRWVALIAHCREARTIGELLEARRALEALDSQVPGRADVQDALLGIMRAYFAATRDAGLVQEMEETATWLRERHGTNPALRVELGEVERDGAWVLEETARTLDGEAGLDACLAKAREATPQPGEATKVEAAIELPWARAASTAHVRVAGTADAKHIEAVAVACEAAGALFEQALRVAPAWRAGLTVVLLGSEGERETFLKGYPTVDNPTLTHRKDLDLVYADGSTLVIRALQDRGQLDLAVNEILNQMVSDTFLGHETPLAWHAEGISRYLAWKITGTRMAINVSKKYAGDTKDRAVPDADAHWLKSARVELGQGPAELQLLLGKGTDAFTARDALISYAFSIYLIEGYGGLTGEFLKSHHKSKDVDRACRELLARPRAVIEHRLLRWADEVIAGQKSNR